MASSCIQGRRQCFVRAFLDRVKSPATERGSTQTKPVGDDVGRLRVGLTSLQLQSARSFSSPWSLGHLMQEPISGGLDIDIHRVQASVYFTPASRGTAVTVHRGTRSTSPAQQTEDTCHRRAICMCVVCCSPGVRCNEANTTTSIPDRPTTD
jgi:hypothetical protein